MHQTMKQLKILLLTGFFLVATPAMASVLSVEPNQTLVVSIGDTFEVSVIIDTEGDPLNAVEGALMYPKDILAIERISDGNSIVDYWIESPKEVDGQISFSGITTGGFSVRRGALLSVRFKAEAEGAGSLAFLSGRALLNDGMGTEASMQFLGSTVEVSGAKNPVPHSIADDDTDPPEDFDVYITSDSAIAEGAYVAVFATQDKGSGVAEYKIKEGFFSRYKDATSPHVLAHQSLDRMIFIRAYDHAGNTRTSMHVPINPPYVIYAIALGGVLLMVTVLLYFVLRHAWHRARIFGRS